MKHSTLKNIVLPGIFCAACLGASVWYSVVFNHSRLIAPTDFSTYVFRVQDLPLMLACILCAAYLIWLFVRGFQHAQQQKSSATTRTIDPRFGFLGLMILGRDADRGSFSLCVLFVPWLFRVLF